MSTLRVSNIEAKADPSSPSIDEKLKVTNSNGDVLVHIDGKTAGITTVGINTTDSSFTVDAAQNIEFIGIVTATKFSLSGGGEITGGDGNFTGIVTATSISATDSTIGVLTASSANFTGNVSIAGTLTYEDVTNVDSIGIATARTGIDVTGGHIDLVDNSKIRVGTGEDLQIYHDPGTGDSFISETGSGNLKLTTSSFRLRNAADTEHIIWANQDAEVRLYHDNSKKFETTSSGAIVTGILTASTFSGNLTGNITGNVTGNLTGESTLSGISSSISDTAVDVFVYDTRKDSDGGAWRKRTQNTSWFNETLGTATRGTRKEFPAVAVIVAEAEQLTIYDGDDPDLPMWMVFNKSDTGANKASFISYPTIVPSSIFMQNGILCVALSSGGWGVSHIGFISDHQKWYWTTGTYAQKANGIVNRNVSGHWYTISIATTARILDANTNDLAMTVLPDAPIDPSTGLPVPTIAVGTDSGLSVITDSGSVFDDATSAGIVAGVESCAFSGTKIVCCRGGASGNKVYVQDASTISADFTSERMYRVSQYGETNEVQHVCHGLADIDEVEGSDDNLILGAEEGIVFIDEDLDSPTNGLVAKIASDYNTGWMQGNAKGAFLSDTDTTNVVGGGDGLITGNDSTFGAVITSLNWSERSGSGGGWNVSGGVLKTGTVSSGEYLDITTSGYTSGQTYVISYTLSNVTGSNPIRLRFNDGQMGNLPTSNGSHSYYVTLTETGTLFSLLNDSSLTADIDNFKLQLVQDEDRSVNNKGLAVYGTITKTAVATGAELVSYSGWSASNNLVQPYNSDLNFGTGDFCFVAWIKKTSLSTNHYVLDRNDGGSESDRFSFMINAAGKINVYSGSTNAQAESAVIFVGSPKWRMVMVKRDGGAITFGLDGKEYTSTTTVGNWSTTNLTGSGNENLFIGQYGGGTPGNATFNVDYGIGEIANVRLSASAPSAEQFKKMYEEEKHLYNENAKATLYGSSDAVTALTYDEVTNLLHVGTSAGRSDFQGLCRINNTTTAVTTAISAHDEFIIEQ